MSQKTVDLRSDTITKPTDEMREAMRDAEVGDDSFGDDPTVNRLQTMAAERLGMEAAVFVPTGSMGNGLAILLHTKPGERIICHTRAHVMARDPFFRTAGIEPVNFDADFGVITPAELQAIVDTAQSDGRPSLLCLENSHNFSGGNAWLLQEVEAISAAARASGLKLHMDGARLFNSCVALGVEAAEYARHVDSVMFCVSKGLSAPVGSLLCGSSDFVAEARALRSGIGGAMRQAGIVAAAGIMALEKMVDRLVKDHEHARLLCEGLSTIDGISPRQPPRPTNFVMVNTRELGHSSAELKLRLESEGVRSIERPPHDLRLVIHRHIGGEDLEYTIEAFRRMQ